MESKPDVKVGDEVRVFDVNGRRVGQPEGGWVGTVTAVARKLVTISYPGHRGQVFRLDSGQSNDAYAHQSFKTLEEADQGERNRVARHTLRDAGFDIQFSASPSLPLLEALAAVVETFGQEG